MTRAFAAAVALAAAVACGGGGGEARTQPSPSTPAPTTGPAVTPGGQEVLDAVEKTVAACPCAVEMTVHAFSGRTSYRATYTGVYDPATRTSVLKGTGEERGLELRVVDGTTYLQPDPGGPWIHLDFGGMPATVKTAFGPLVLVDPALSFAAASNTVAAEFVSEHPLGRRYEVEYDLAAAAREAGPLFARMLPEPTSYDDVVLAKSGGTIAQIGLETPDQGGSVSSVSALLVVRKTGVAAPQVTAPDAATKVDVATFEQP